MSEPYHHSIADLNNTVIYKISKFLNFIDILNVSTTCISLNYITDYIKKLNLRFNRKITYDILLRLPGITKLDVTSTRILFIPSLRHLKELFMRSTYGIRVLPRLPNLEVLHADNSTLECVPSLPNLKYLSLGFVEDIKIVSLSTKITYLNLAGNKSISNKELKLPNLTYLNIINRNINYSIVELPNLTTLRVTNNNTYNNTVNINELRKFLPKLLEVFVLGNGCEKHYV